MNIEVEISTFTLGENTEKMNQRFIKAVKRALKKEYPKADIDVGLTENVTASSVYVDGNANSDEAENVNYIIDRVWSKANY